jgi:anti-sigma regulatory factor (Ser/Thr protein kinase)
LAKRASAHTGDDVNDGTSTSTPPDGGSEPAHQRPLVDVPDVRFTLPAVPANVALVRQALAGFADELGVEPARAADMKIALTEACTNAVVHAYGDGDGPLEVTMGVDHGRLVLTVRDRGHGLRPLPSESEGPPLGFGLALIASLSDEFGIAGGHHGTEVRIAFSLDGTDDAPPLVVQLSPGEAPPSDEVVLALTPGGQAASVLGRVVSLVAARADFSIDRLSDAQILSDAIAGAAANHTLDGYLRVGIEESDGGFELVIGPLVPGGGESLIRDTELPGLGRLLERLADDLSVEPADEGELLRARLGERA